MVVHLDGEAHLLERQAHRRANVLQRVDRRNREIAALDARPVAEVAFLDLLVALPRALVGLDRV